MIMPSSPAHAVALKLTDRERQTISTKLASALASKLKDKLNASKNGMSGFSRTLAGSKKNRGRGLGH
jgi:hypothetical protein